MKKSISFRIIIDLLIVVSLLNAWWFFVLPLTLVGLWIFPYYIEIVIAGLVYDSLFGMSKGMGWRGYEGLIVSSVAVLIFIFLKKVVRK